MTQAWRTAVAVCMAVGALAATGFGALPRTGAEMEAAHGEEAIKVKDDVLAGMPPASSPVARNKYAEEVIKEFKGELASTNGDARLNTAILIEHLEALACDNAFEEMLTSSDAAVRLWGAKGLGAIAESVKKVGGATLTRATKSLKDAAAKERSDVVKGQIAQTLAMY